MLRCYFLPGKTFEIMSLSWFPNKGYITVLSACTAAPSAHVCFESIDPFQ